MTRKLDDYRLGDKVEVAVAFGTKDVAWWPGKVTAIRRHLEDNETRITMTVLSNSGGMWTLNERNTDIIRYPNDAIPVGEEVECSLDGGKTWTMTGRITSRVSDNTSYWVHHGAREGYRHWPTDCVRRLTKVVRSADDLAKELERVTEQLREANAKILTAEQRNAHMEGEWKRIVEVNGKFVEEAWAANERAAKAEAELQRVTTCGGCADAEARRAKAEVELAKVKEAHAETTKAHFAASFNLGVARSERDDASKELEREKENHLLLVKTFREVIDKLTKRNRELDEEVDRLKRAVTECAKTNVDAITKIEALTKRAESAEKALAERANIYGVANDKAIQAIEEMWQRKFVALEKKLAQTEAVLKVTEMNERHYHNRAHAAETKIERIAAAVAAREDER
jgi:hypothetical protein